MLLALTASLVAWHRSILRWHTVVCVVLAVVLFIPIGRFSLPVNLPIGLEPYRVAVAFVLAAWAGSLLVDPSLRLRRSPLDAPIVVVVAASLGSVVVNFHRVIPLEGAVLKNVTFFLSFVLVYYFIVSVVVTRSAIEIVTRFFVGGVAFIAAAAVVEQRTRFNIFDHAASFLPFLQFQGSGEIVPRRRRSGHRPGAAPHRARRPLRDGHSDRYRAGTWLAPPLVDPHRSDHHRAACVDLADPDPLGALRGPRALRPAPEGDGPPLAAGRPALDRDQFRSSGIHSDRQGLVLPEGGPHRATNGGGAILRSSARGRPCSSARPDARGGEPNAGTRAGNGDAADRFRQSASKCTHPRQPMARPPSRGRRDRRLGMGLVDLALHLSACAASRTRAGPDGWLAAGYAGAIASFSIGMFTYDSLSFVQVAFVFWVILALSRRFCARRPRSRARRDNQGSRFRGRGRGHGIWRRSSHRALIYHGPLMASGASLNDRDTGRSDSRRLIIAVGGGWPNGGGEAPVMTRMASRDASLRRRARCRSRPTGMARSACRSDRAPVQASRLTRREVLVQVLLPGERVLRQDPWTDSDLAEVMEDRHRREDAECPSLPDGSASRDPPPPRR